MLQGNIQILAYLKQYFKADLYYESAMQALKQFDHATANGTLRPDSTVHASAVPATAPVTSQSSQSSPQPGCLEYMLNPLGTYPMARSQIPELHGTKAGTVDDYSGSDVHNSRAPVLPDGPSLSVAGIQDVGGLVGSDSAIGPTTGEPLN